MVDKLHDYQGLVGRLHTLRESVRSRWYAWKESRCQQNGRGLSDLPLDLFKKKAPKQEEEGEFSHIYRRKTRGELLRISAAVMGIEFSYAAETAFVSPILLKIGVKHEHMTLVWALSPLVGFFVTPVLGSLSDRCHLPWGRRRPFIFVLSVGILLGLLLVPNGEAIGFALGDYYPSREHAANMTHTNFTELVVHPDAYYPHPWSVFFTVLGTVLLDFDADACQSPSRAYLLDVTLPEDHARGLSTFTIMAGLGGFMGYALGAINWDQTALGEMLGGHVRAVFTLITFIFTICVVFTITSFREIPLRLLEQGETKDSKAAQPEVTEEDKIVEDRSVETYGAVVTSETGGEIVDPYKPIDGNNGASNGYINYGYDESYHQQITISETSFSRQDIKVR